MKPIWKFSFTLQDLQRRCENSLVSHMGIVFIEIGADYLIAEMPIESHHLQPVGILHGGASAVLAETLASVAASCVIDSERQTCVGLDLNINHLKPMKSGILKAKTFPYHIGRTTQVWSIEIRDDQARLIAISRLTVANLDK